MRADRHVDKNPLTKRIIEQNYNKHQKRLEQLYTRDNKIKYNQDKAFNTSQYISTQRLVTNKLNQNQMIEDKNRQLLRKLIEISTQKNKPYNKIVQLRNSKKIEVQDSIRIQNESMFHRIKQQRSVVNSNNSRYMNDYSQVKKMMQKVDPNKEVYPNLKPNLTYRLKLEKLNPEFDKQPINPKSYRNKYTRKQHIQPNFKKEVLKEFLEDEQNFEEKQNETQDQYQNFTFEKSQEESLSENNDPQQQQQVVQTQNVLEEDQLQQNNNENQEQPQEEKQNSIVQEEPEDLELNAEDQDIGKQSPIDNEEYQQDEEEEEEEEEDDPFQNLKKANNQLGDVE